MNLDRAITFVSKLFLKRNTFFEELSDERVIQMVVQDFSWENELLYRGREEGIEQGREQEKKEMIQGMLKQRIAFDIIKVVAQISDEELESIKKELLNIY